MSLEELREAPEAAPWGARASPAGSVPIGRTGLRGQSRGVPLGQVLVVVVANLHFNRFLLTQRGLFSPSRAQRCAWPVKPTLLRWAAAAASSRSARLEGSPAVARRRFPSRDSEPRGLSHSSQTRLLGKLSPWTALRSRPSCPGGSCSYRWPVGWSKARALPSRARRWEQGCCCP